jgi:hypothetical protein
MFCTVGCTQPAVQNSFGVQSKSDIQYTLALEVVPKQGGEPSVQKAPLHNGLRREN